MKDLIWEYYKDIIITIIFVIISIPVWINFSKNKVDVIDTNDVISYQILNNPSYSLNKISDDYALKYIETGDIIVYNNTYIENEYLLLLKLDNNINYDNVKINVNYKIDYLNSYESFVKDDSKYYIIDNNNIVAKSQKYVISLWNSGDNIDSLIVPEYIISNNTKMA